jgi:hypothetical protein
LKKSTLIITIFLSAVLIISGTIIFLDLYPFNFGFDENDSYGSNWAFSDSSVFEIAQPGNITLSGGEVISNRVHANRDFFPPEPDTRLTVFIELGSTVVNSTRLNSTQFLQVWVHYKTSVRTSNVTNYRYFSNKVLWTLFGGGPCWDTGIKIDITLKIEIDETIHYILWQDQVITESF